MTKYTGDRFAYKTGVVASRSLRSTPVLAHNCCCCTAILLCERLQLLLSNGLTSKIANMSGAGHSNRPCPTRGDRSIGGPVKRNRSEGIDPARAGSNFTNSNLGDIQIPS